MTAKIRKIVTFLEETRAEMGRAVNPPTRRAAAVAVIENPCALKYVDDLSQLMTIGEELGGLLTQRAVAALGIPPGEKSADREVTVIEVEFLGECDRANVVGVIVYSHDSK